MMSIKINLNADMAEGFGVYEIGDDANILKIISPRTSPAVSTQVIR